MGWSGTGATTISHPSCPGDRGFGSGTLCPLQGVGGVGVPAGTEAARTELRGGRQENFKGQARGRQAAPALPSPVLMAS